MSTKQLTSKEYFRILNILYIGLLAGQVFFAIITLFLNLNGIEASNKIEFNGILIYIVPVIIVGAIYASQIVYKNKLNEIKNKLNLLEKMSDFRTACIMRWALIEFPSFAAILVCFVTGNLLFLGMAALPIAYYITLKPDIEKTANDLELDYNEKIKINDPDAIIAEMKLNDN